MFKTKIEKFFYFLNLLFTLYKLYLLLEYISIYPLDELKEYFACLYFIRNPCVPDFLFRNLFSFTVSAFILFCIIFCIMLCMVRVLLEIFRVIRIFIEFGLEGYPRLQKYLLIIIDFIINCIHNLLITFDLL